MDAFMLYPSVLFLAWVFHHAFRFVQAAQKSGGAATQRLPPGPYPLPVIGNILAIGQRPHESLCNLSKTYGPLMCLKLGSITTIVASSPAMAKELLQKHDQVFSGRPIPCSVRFFRHHETSVAWLPASAPWRMRRKICKEHMFSGHRLDACEGLRRRMVDELLDFVEQSCVSGQAVEIGQAAFTASLNLISNTSFSMDMARHGSSQEFKNLVCAIMELAAKPNFADYFPFLRFMDPQGISREINQKVHKIFMIFDEIINQRLQSSSQSPNSDILDFLLNLTKENNTHWSCNDTKHFLISLLVAGTETISTTVEWVMVKLLEKPEKMRKAQDEIRKVIGKEGQVEESDIPKLPYLQAVVKETFRLHPPGPLLLPHKAEEDVEVGGFMVPKNAQVLVNVWAIGRDAKVWPHPDSFVPERFLGQEREIDYMGQDFELIPFSAGRRICPGLPLAHRMVHLILGSLLYSFDWKLEGGMKPEEIDLGVKFGITLQKAIPLRAVPIKI